MRIPGALALLIMVAGCTPAFDISGREWTKPGISTQQVTLDETECARQAFAAGWTPCIGPTLTGIIAILVWTFLTALALFLGLAFAAQLEAVRAGVPEPVAGGQINLNRPAWR